MKYINITWLIYSTGILAFAIAAYLSDSVSSAMIVVGCGCILAIIGKFIKDMA